ncbi:protein TonB [Duganella sp. 1224]|uniref:energy transducer TonB n=1 Tax=Duganella sp. 1224 TaxID=2587052 RepID=UPI0015C7D503|nr:energy transducer TonB [Duganella sp. 1224]NYE58964.1 protein TonB [Duganella sp. 1224]
MNQKKNLTGISTVVLLHAVLLAVFLHGSRLTVFHAAPPVIDVLPTPDVPTPKPLDPPVALPTMPQPPIFAPDPLPDLPPQMQPTVTTRPLADQPPATPPTGAVGDSGTRPAPSRAAPVVTAAVVDAQACAKPDYPKNALRNGDTGTVLLALLVGPDGKVADSRIEKSSGFRELDRAAQAGLSLCKFKPGTVDGVPQPVWTRMQYVWSLD